LPSQVRFLEFVVSDPEFPDGNKMVRGVCICSCSCGAMGRERLTDHQLSEYARIVKRGEDGRRWFVDVPSEMISERNTKQ